METSQIFKGESTWGETSRGELDLGEKHPGFTKDNQNFLWLLFFFFSINAAK